MTTSAIPWVVTHWVANHYWLTAFILIVGYGVWEQLWLRWHGRRLPGPRWVVPFVGNIVQMVLHPYQFWHTHFDIPGLSWDYLLVNSNTQQYTCMSPLIRCLISVVY